MNSQEKDNMRVEARDLVRKLREEFKLMQLGERRYATRQPYGGDTEGTIEESVATAGIAQGAGATAQGAGGAGGTDGGAETQATGGAGSTI